MSEIRVDTISEKTSANGVAVDGITIKDGGIAATAASTITTADNTDTLTLISTDADANVGPNLNLYRNSSSPADNDTLGQLAFVGRNDNSQDFNAFQMTAYSPDVSDGTEDGIMQMFTMQNGSLHLAMQITPTETVFNDSSKDQDFRVESNGATHQLFVDGGNNKVYMGSGSGNSIDNMHLQLQNQGLTVSSFAGDANSNEIHFIKSRNTTVGSSTVVADGDQLGSIVFQGDDGTDYATPGASIRAIVGGTPGGNDMPGALIFSTTADGAATVSERMRIDRSGKVGIGETTPLCAAGGLHVKSGDSGQGTANPHADELVVEGSANSGINILSGASGYGSLYFGDSGDSNAGEITYNHSSNYMAFATSGSEQMRLNADGILSLNEAAPDGTDGSLCLNQAGGDGIILSLKSSDVAHGMTDNIETDTYFSLGKRQGAGGTLIHAMNSELQALRIIAAAGAENTTKGTTGNGPFVAYCTSKSSSGFGSVGSNANMFIVSNNGNTKFIVDAEGDIHADGSLSAYDNYDDAHLVRAYDLSHGKGVIDSKFDKFVSYNHEKLADMKLVGREEDGTPNHFINVTGMQRLHNGAIWQQYEKTERLAKAMYELAKAAVGEEKANEILEQNEIKLLN